MTHELKAWPAPFADLEARRKRFEIRIDDREYKHGDKLLIREWDPHAREHTGRALICHVTVVVRAESYGGMLHGLIGPNAVVLGLEFDEERKAANRQRPTAAGGRR